MHFEPQGSSAVGELQYRTIFCHQHNRVHSSQILQLPPCQKQRQHYPRAKTVEMSAESCQIAPEKPFDLQQSRSDLSPLKGVAPKEGAGSGVYVQISKMPKE